MEATTPAGLIVPVSALDTIAADTPYRSASKFNRAMQHWFPAAGSADDALLPSLDTLRRQSRDLDRNEAIARGATENLVDNVVHTGLRPQAKVDHELLGISSKEARAFERMAEKIYNMHADSIYSDFAMKSPMPINQALVLRAVLLDGDCLVIRRFKERPGAILATSIQIVAGSRIRNPDTGYIDREIREGVELDSDGVPVAYHIANSDGYHGLQQKTVRVPRFDKQGMVIASHLFKNRLPDQTRGEPYLAPIVEKIKQISRYTEAEISAAVLSAFFSVFVTSEGASPFGNKASAHLAQREEQQKTRNTQPFGSGTIVDLFPGEKVESVAPGRPNVNFDSFVSAVLKLIGMAIRIPFEVLLSHFSSSYTAARGAILKAWRTYQSERGWLAPALCQLSYEWFTTEAVFRGIMNAPGFEDPFKRQVYLGTEWIGSSMESIDELKDAKADSERIKNGTTSRRAIVEGSGRDFEKLRREREAEADMEARPEKKSEGHFLHNSQE